VIIFTGGTGNPYFSTDTAAILRALQVGASTVWKATTIDYVYDDDPSRNTNAQPIKTATYQDVLMRKLKVMDLTAITLAQEHNITLRIFSIYAPNALGQVAENNNFGSTISS
jgi:uridylate kinase